MKHLFLFMTICAVCLEAQYDTSIVATVGPYTISSDDLVTSFEFGPAFVHRHHDPLREHLQYMIYEHLLALGAVRNGLQTADFVQERIKALEEDGAVEQLYKQDILSQVTLTESQIETDVRKARIIVSIRWIYCPTQREAEQIIKKITAGAPFDSLYAVQFGLSMSAESRSLTSSLLKLERDNEELAKTVLSLKTGGISPPVRGNDGYYILHLDRSEENPILTESEYTELRNQAIKIRTKLTADGLADQYVKNIMQQHAPVIKADGFNILGAFLADKGLSRDTKVTWEIPLTFMTEAGPQPIKNSAKYLHRTLVTFGSRSLTIRDYAQWYDIRQFQFDTRSQQAFNSSVKKTIWKMVQDRLLSEEAYRRGLDRLPSVAHETKKWEVKLLYLSQRAAVARTINLSDSVLKKYYSVNKKRYTNSKADIMKFPAVRESVKRDYFDDEESLLLIKTIESMRQQYTVSINEEVLRELSRKTASNRRTIETVFYKPGGTFPRIAFPTIDEAWGKNH